MSNGVMPSPWYSTLQQLKSEVFKELRVCLPGEISAIDTETGTVSVRIGLMQTSPSSVRTSVAPSLILSSPCARCSRCRVVV